MHYIFWNIILFNNCFGLLQFLLESLKRKKKIFSQSPPSNFRLCLYTSNNSLIKIFHFDPRPVIIQYDNVNSGCTYYISTLNNDIHIYSYTTTKLQLIICPCIKFFFYQWLSNLKYKYILWTEICFLRSKLILGTSTSSRQTVLT